MIKYNIALLLSPESTQHVVDFSSKLKSKYDFSFTAESDPKSDFHPHISVYKFLASRDVETQVISHLDTLKEEIPNLAISTELGATRKKGYLYYRLKREGLANFQQRVIEGLTEISKEPLDRYKQYVTDDLVAQANYRKYLSYEVLDGWNPHITIGRLHDESLVEEALKLYPIGEIKFSIEKVQLYAEGFGSMYQSS